MYLMIFLTLGLGYFLIVSRKESFVRYTKPLVNPKAAVFFVIFMYFGFALVVYSENRDMKIQTKEDKIRYEAILSEIELVTSDSGTDLKEKVSKLEVLRDISEWNQYVIKETSDKFSLFIGWPSVVSEHTKDLQLIEIPEF